MKNKFALLTIATLITTNIAMADITLSEVNDATGEAFFMPATPVAQTNSKNDSGNHSVPPIKRLRLKIKNSLKHKYELAPVKEETYAGEIGTSSYASKEVVDNFEDMVPDGFEADEESTIETEKRKKGFFGKKKDVAKTQSTEDIILDCDNVDYDTQNYKIYAKGNVNLTFVKQGIIVRSDEMVYDRTNNTIKAEGNVKINKDERVITGDYIFVDMNEENALIENPITDNGNIRITAEKGYVYGDKVVQEHGKMTVQDSYKVDFSSDLNGPHVYEMLTPKDQNLTTAMGHGDVLVKTKEIKITQDGDHEIIYANKIGVKKGKHTILKIPSARIFTNKNHEYAEMDSLDVGAYRGLGTYLGYGWVFKMPKGSALKVMPLITSDGGFGIGGMARFNSGTNKTTLSYGTSRNRFILLGNQKLDDNLYLHYGVNSYMDEWFFGSRRPKYGVALVYNKSYSSDNFLLKNRASSFKHRLEGGYFQDLDFDNAFEKIHGNNTGTARFRYMAEAQQDLISYKNEDKLTMFNLGVRGQLSTALYGTGDTQVVGRVGPLLTTQYKRWKQDIGYFFSAYEDNTPMPVFDAYRYARQNLYLREYFRICKYLTVSWFSSINMTGDAPNNKKWQENGFYISVGPDDVKLNLGYDFARENLFFTVDMKLDAKGTNVEYDSFELKQVKKASGNDKIVDETEFKAPVGKPVLQKAVVENIKVMEDVL